MEEKLMLKKASIEKLTAALALPATGQEQDWDAELADAARIGEFLHAYQNLPLTPDDRIALMALILASVEIRLSVGLDVADYWEQIAAMLGRERDLYREMIGYWACEGENDPEAWFHLTPMVRRAEAE
ncbi:hypothetical protein HUA78_19750 [Myxococcus sp. CA033]|uniref:hypothetical protein n=1 Tax=Myxococcus sp. CA033 TaxID=2741516 RepID=UPI00157B7CF5|nr:hypothetical protein [Myxococcus sp. CA033]NTX36685.1 hypothetical protein [Myxococcus sp. CA033]